MERLDEKKIRALLQEADDKWYAKHSGRWDYSEHLDFVADYITQNYHRSPKRGEVKLGSRGK